MKWKVQITMVGVTAMGKRDINNFVKMGFNDVGVYWHDKFLKRHFTGAAFRLYGYTERSRKYWFRKLKKTGMALPLVYSGESRLSAKEFATIRPTHKAVKISMPARKLNLKSPGQRVDMADELRRIAPSEYKTLEGVMARSLRSRFRAAKKRVKVTIGG